MGSRIRPSRAGHGSERDGHPGMGKQLMESGYHIEGGATILTDPVSGNGLTYIGVTSKNNGRYKQQVEPSDMYYGVGFMMQYNTSAYNCISYNNHMGYGYQASANNVYYQDSDSSSDYGWYTYAPDASNPISNSITLWGAQPSMSCIAPSVSITLVMLTQILP